MLTTPQHLILPLVFPGVRIRLIFVMGFFMFLIWAFILTADFSVYVTGFTNFGCRLFCSPNLSILILTTDIWIWNWAHCGCDRSTGDALSSGAPDPNFVFVGVCVALHTILYWRLDCDDVLHIINFTILYLLCAISISTHYSKNELLAALFLTESMFYSLM
jgi:hypothetical protein